MTVVWKASTRFHFRLENYRPVLLWNTPQFQTRLNVKETSGTFGKTGTISSSGITKDRSIVLIFMSATSEEVSYNSTDAVFPDL